MSRWKSCSGKNQNLPAENFQDLREQLATTERTRKQKDLGLEELRKLWEAQLSKGDRESLKQLQKNPAHGTTNEKELGIMEAVQWAEEHLFDRNSIVLECQLWQEALGRARGGDFSISELTEFTRQRSYIRDKEHPNRVTLREVLMREWEIVQTVREGVAALHPLVRNPAPINPRLDDEQQTAIKALLASTNTVSVFRGGAGTGKSFVLQELVGQVQQSGRPVVVMAPQRQQVAEMEKAGIPSPTTIAGFLIKHELAMGAVVVVDEAGQIGGRQMLDLMRLVRERNARLILSGDTRQHGAVEASDALLAIERHRALNRLSCIRSDARIRQ